jgi:hypothetical protein
MTVPGLSKQKEILSQKTSQAQWYISTIPPILEGAVEELLSKAGHGQKHETLPEHIN